MVLGYEEIDLFIRVSYEYSSSLAPVSESHGHGMPSSANQIMWKTDSSRKKERSGTRSGGRRGVGSGLVGRRGRGGGGGEFGPPPRWDNEHRTNTEDRG